MNRETSKYHKRLTEKEINNSQADVYVSSKMRNMVESSELALDCYSPTYDKDVERKRKRYLNPARLLPTELAVWIDHNDIIVEKKLNKLKL